MENRELYGILAHFFAKLDENQCVFSTLTSGHINDTFLARVGEQSFILQRLNPHIFTQPAKIAANIQRVAHHLQKKQYPKAILECLPTHAGDFHVHTEGGAWRLLPYVSATFSTVKVENPQQAFEAAKAFGEYVRFLDDIDVESVETIIPNFHNADFRIQQFETALSNHPSVERLQRAEKALAFVYQALPKFRNVRLNVPQRVTHNDTKISNILFDVHSGAAKCIIDLDTLQPGTILSDFGDMVRTYTPQYDEDEADLAKVTVRMDYFEALCAGFLSELRDVLTTEEVSQLFWGAQRTIFVQALRFLTDYLNNDVYYKTHSEHHNLQRATNQLALYASLSNHQTEAERIVKSNSK